MDRPLIITVGLALYGTRWQSELARALGVSIRTVQRWAAGTETPRAGVYRDLLELVRERSGALGQLVPALEQAARATAAPQPSRTTAGPAARRPPAALAR